MSRREFEAMKARLSFEPAKSNANSTGFDELLGKCFYTLKEEQLSDHSGNIDRSSEDGSGENLTSSSPSIYPHMFGNNIKLVQNEKGDLSPTGSLDPKNDSH